MLKKVLCVLCAAVCALSLTACWDYVEVNTMLIVAGIGLDIDSAGERYIATVEFVNVEADGGENIAAEIVKGEGNTIHAAIQNALLTAGGIMFANHCKVIVVGEALAEKGLDDIVEIVLRSPDFRKTLEIMIAKDTTASEIFSNDTIVNEIASYELVKILKNNEQSVKNTVSTNSYELHETLLGEASFSVLPSVSVKTEGKDSILLVDGCAILADGRLQGFLNSEECKLYQLITRKKQNIALTFQDAYEGPIDVTIADCSVSALPALQNDELTIDLHLRVKATLEEAVLSGINPMRSEDRKQLEQTISEQLPTKILSLITKMQEQYSSDIFEFYAEYQDVYRQDWGSLQRDWASHFRKMEVHATADVTITGSGLIGNYTDNNDNAVALP